MCIDSTRSPLGRKRIGTTPLQEVNSADLQGSPGLSSLVSCGQKPELWTSSRQISWRARLRPDVGRCSCSLDPLPGRCSCPASGIEFPPKPGRHVSTCDARNACAVFEVGPPPDTTQTGIWTIHPRSTTPSVCQSSITCNGDHWSAWLGSPESF